VRGEVRGEGIICSPVCAGGATAASSARVGGQGNGGVSGTCGRAGRRQRLWRVWASRGKGLWRRLDLTRANRLEGEEM
jgi:hypothetical protein